MSTTAARVDMGDLRRLAEESEEVTVTRDRYGYRVNGDFLRRVTTFCGGIPKPWLGGWAAKEVATFAVENRDAWKDLGKTDAMKLLKGAPWSKRDDAGDRGTAVHKAIEAVVNGDDLPEDLQTEDELECAIAAEAFLDEFCSKFLASELTVFNRKHGYAGTLDLWCLDKDGVPWIIDFKTSKSVYAEHAIQQAAYLNAEYAVVQKRHTGKKDEEKWAGKVIPWGPDRAERIGVLHVRPDGATLHPIRYTDRLWTVFRAAAHVKLFLLDTDSFRKTPRERVYGDPTHEVTTKEGGAE